MSDDIKVDWNGKVYTLNIKRVDVAQGMEFLNTHRLTILEYNQGIEKLDPRSIQCLMWLMLQQNGERARLKDLNFDVFDYMEAVNKGHEENEAAKTAACEFCDDDGLIVHTNGNEEVCTHDPKVEAPPVKRDRSIGSRPKISKS